MAEGVGLSFAEMLADQRAYQERMPEVYGQLTEHDRARMMEHLLFLGIQETGELMQELGMKHHRPFAGFNWQNAKIEWIDCMKYLMAVAVVAGWDAAELEQAWTQKSTVINERLTRDRAATYEVPCAVFDMDGVLVKYKRAYTDAEMGGGVLRYAEPMLETIGFLPTLRSWGYKVLIVTSRKVWQWKQLEVDTELWLKENRVEYDQLIFAHDKREAVKRYNVKFAVEDSAKHALDYAESDIPTFFIESLDPDSRVPRHLNVYPTTIARLPVEISDLVKKLENPVVVR